MCDIGARLGEIGNAVKLGKMTATETFQLRQDIPDPVRLFSSAFQFGERRRVALLLCVDEAGEVEVVGWHGELYPS